MTKQAVWDASHVPIYTREFITYAAIVKIIVVLSQISLFSALNMLISYLSFLPTVPCNHYLKSGNAYLDLVLNYVLGKWFFIFFLCSGGLHYFCIQKGMGSCWWIPIIELKKCVCEFKTLNFVYFYSDEHTCFFSGLVPGKSQ